jgi:hypothetical protein
LNNLVLGRISGTALTFGGTFRRSLAFIFFGQRTKH